MTDEWSDVSRDLVYGEVGSDLVFIPRDRAEELAGVYAALQDASTWGDFKQRVSAERWQQAMSRLDDEPSDGDLCRAESIFGYEDGDWPEWAAQRMLDWVPASISQQFGTVDDSVLNGSFLHFDPADRAEVVAALESAGFKCQEDSLVLDASGH